MSTFHPLHGAYLKLQRAAIHRETLQRDINKFFQHEPNRVVSALNDEGTAYVLDLLEPLPTRWSTIAGDCLQNLRSTLEHLTTACASRSSTEPKALRDVEFPITSSASHWTNYSTGRRGKANRAAIGEDSWKIVEDMQPYTRTLPDLKADPLWGLSELARIDRHQTLHLAVIEQQDTLILFGPLQRHGNVILNRPVKELAPFATESHRDDPVIGGAITVEPADPDFHTYGQLTFDVCLDKDAPVPGTRLIDALEAFEQAVRWAALPAFEALFR